MDPNDDKKPFDTLLDELDKTATQLLVELATGDGWKCLREKPRRPFRIRCEVWWFHDGTTVRQDTVQTRNISERGISLVSRGPIPKGAPIEIRISAPGLLFYVGGVVSFCRYTAKGFHEVGIMLKAQDRKPMFHEDPMGSVATVPWVREALRSPAHRARDSALGTRPVAPHLA
jgi:PilZ domain